MDEIKIPRAIVRGGGDALSVAKGEPGEWVEFKEMNGSSALQTARKYNGSVGGEGFVFGVDEERGMLLVKYVGNE